MNPSSRAREHQIVALATTGIGSLPALDFSLSTTLDVPYLVEVEPMLDIDSDRALTRFLDALDRSRVIKLQTVGPVTSGRPAEARAQRMIDQAKRRGHEVLFFFDEPALGDALPITRLEGAEVGVHCCGDADWESLCRSEIGWISFDVARSWSALSPHLEHFAGGLVFGAIPTDVPELRDAMDPVIEWATTASRRELIRRSMISPACGLALHTIEHAQAVIGALPGIRARVLDRCLHR